ncbi:hypothetical protein CRV24_007925 [Beauveria bassiana]|nr:hypothetical protein CRV24_007925 [Beauveria bassiana]
MWVGRWDGGYVGRGCMSHEQGRRRTAAVTDETGRNAREGRGNYSKHPGSESANHFDFDRIFGPVGSGLSDSSDSCLIYIRCRADFCFWTLELDLPPWLAHVV